MRSLCFLAALLFCAYCFHRPAAPAMVAVPVVVPTPPPPRLKLYYHSPLDAPAMATGAVTGYYSTTEASSFGQGARLDGGATKNTRSR